MASINRITRDQQAQDNPFIGMSPEQLTQVINTAKQNIGQQRGQGIKQGIGRALTTASDLFLQAGGMTPPKREMPNDTLNDLIMRERVKQMFEGDPQDKLKRELQIKAEIEQSDPLYQAKLKALNAPEPIIPTSTGALGEEVDTSVMPHSLSESRNDEYEPIYKNIAGIPKIVGYKKVKTNIAEKKLDIAQEEAKKKNIEHSQFVKDSAQDALNTIAEVEKGITKFGLFGQLPSIPGTPRANWEANVNKLLSGKVINVMTTMKEASKTGATGFGQLSEKELKVLQEASTALKRNLSPKDAQKYLNEMKVKLQKISQGNGSEGAIQDKVNQARAAGYSDEEIQVYLSGR